MAKVQQFYNKNQFIITDEDNYTFQSYDSTIALIHKRSGHITLGKDWGFSHTTLKHLYLFLTDYKNEIDNFTYAQLFHKGFEQSKNKRAFLQNLIDKRYITLDYNL